MQNAAYVGAAEISTFWVNRAHFFKKLRFIEHLKGLFACFEYNICPVKIQARHGVCV